jgi:PfaB family protein
LAYHSGFADGAVAFVLKRHDDAVRDGDRIYAVLRDIQIAGAASQDKASPESTPADNFAHTGAASGLFSVFRSALAISDQILPPTRKDASTSPPQYWLRNRADGPRRAIAMAHSTDGNAARAVLEESFALKKPVIGSTARETLIAVTGDTTDELVERLREIRSSIDHVGISSAQSLATQAFHDFPPRANHLLAVSILLDGVAPLSQLVSDAENYVLRNHPVRGPNVFYEPRPICSPAHTSNELALVFPGAGNQYLKMGHDLARAFPDVLRRLDAENERLADQFACGRFWTANNLDGISHKDVAFGQVWLGSLVADVLATFAVRPSAVIGYSLGESAGLFALRAWRDRDEMLRRMETSTLFTHDLAGECRAVRTAWGLRDDPGAPGLEWSIGVVNRPASAVRQALVGRSRVYLLIVNTPSQCVIGGRRQAVDELVAALGCGFHPLQGVTTVHCEVARPAADAYRELHLLPTYPPQNVRFYSGVWARAYELTSESAADSIVAQAIGPFDFPRVIEQAYADGVRIFIEAGPGNSCTRMIGQILGDRPHVALAACASAEHEYVQVLRTLAELVTHRAAVDLSPLFPPGDDPPNAPPSPGRMVSISCIQKPFNVPKPPTIKKRQLIHRAAPSNEWLSRPSRALAQVSATESAKISAQSAFLALSRESIAATQKLLARRTDLASRAQRKIPLTPDPRPLTPDPRPLTPTLDPRPLTPALDRSACLEFATGSIARVLGREFAEIDRHPTRVRLPDEPLMLVDRILSIEGEPRSLSSGRVITEHDIVPHAWYLDGGRIPTCIAVEAGQADLFLSAYLGIDFATRGRAVYRLLDAKVTFHRSLPGPGETIRYHIHIDRFFRQGQMHLFRFRFDATVDGRSLLSMRDGCAGFFTPDELAAGQGIVQTAIDRRQAAGIRPADWRELAPLAAVESYDDHKIDALRRGDLAGCFGDAFANLPLERPAGLPGKRMTLVHRVLRLDPRGGRFGLGQIVGEADMRPDDWFLKCHFIDDRVMPGTLMYECCLHTLRIFLSRMGWVGEADEVAYEPIPGVASQLKCRGQVIETTRKVQYELSIKELGYKTQDGTPYVKADALMYADGRPIVQMNNMSLQLTGLTRAKVEALWRPCRERPPWRSGSSDTMSVAKSRNVTEDIPYKSLAGRPPIFDHDRILAFATGNPSDAFGERYRPFDHDRVIARLPGPPYQFLDRITAIDGCRQWELAAGGVVEAQYDVPRDAWYFAANRQPVMPFAILLEVALQPCGWLAAYLGSALASDVDLSFRNLGGRGVQHRRVTPGSGTLATTVKITKVANSGGMIIENFEFVVRDRAGEVYRGDTYFGFFSKKSLANQVGIREATPYQPSQVEQARARELTYPTREPYPDNMLRMVSRILHFDPQGGPNELGFIRGVADVKPDAWFFKAHFHQDPVWPGSLGLESLLQLVKYVAFQRWGTSRPIVDAVALAAEHRWTYRGQILPTDRQVTVQAAIDRIDDASRTMWASGHLSVDGRLIYQMDDFSVKIDPK